MKPQAQRSAHRSSFSDVLYWPFVNVGWRRWLSIGVLLVLMRFLRGIDALRTPVDIVAGSVAIYCIVCLVLLLVRSRPEAARRHRAEQQERLLAPADEDRHVASIAPDRDLG